MDFSKNLVLIVSLFSLLLLTNSVPLTPFTQVGLLNLCKNTTNPTLCVQTILRQIRGPFNPYKALKAEILATQKQVHKTCGVIARLLANPHNSKQLSDSLSTCREQYNNILDSINESIKDVARRDVIEARFKFSAVLSFHATCDDEFQGPSPFANDANMVYQLGGNCLDIMRAIQDINNNSKEGVSNPPPPPPPPPPPAVYVYSPPDPCQRVIGPCP